MTMDVSAAFVLCVVLFLLSITDFKAIVAESMTTEAPSGQGCVCSCLKSEIPDEKEELEKLGQKEAEKIKEELEVDKTVLSATVRKKKSAEDDRPSAQNVGYMGVAMLTLSFAIIIFMDANYIIEIGHTVYLTAKDVFTPGKIN